MTVAVRRNIHGQIDMEARSVLHNRLRIFRHLLVEQISGIPLLILNSGETAGPNAAAAALAFFRVDIGFARVKADGIRATFLGAFMAVAAKFLIDHALAGRMLFHLPGATAAAHAQILDGTAKARHFMTLEVRERNHDIGIHDRPPNLGRFNIFTIFHGNFHIIGSFQSIANDNLTARRHGIKAVHIGNIHMFQSVFAAAGIKRIAIRQERQTALLLDQIRYHLGILRPQKSQIPHLAKMHLDGHKLAFHIDILDACGNAQTAQFFQPAGSHLRAEAGKINL